MAYHDKNNINNNILCCGVEAAGAGADETFHFEVEEDGHHIAGRDVAGYNEIVQLESFRGFGEQFHNFALGIGQVREQFLLDWFGAVAVAPSHVLCEICCGLNQAGTVAAYQFVAAGRHFIAYATWKGKTGAAVAFCEFGSYERAAF